MKELQGMDLTQIQQLLELAERIKLINNPKANEIEQESTLQEETQPQGRGAF